MSAEIRSSDATNRPSKKILRLIYLVALFAFTLLTALTGHAEHLRELADEFHSALDVIDPLVVTAHLWNHTLWSSEMVHDLARGGILSALILAGAVAILYRMLGAVLTENVPPLQRVWIAFVLSGLVALPLKLVLMTLTAAFGAAMGFILWVNATLIGVIEGLLHLHHVHKGAAEVKEAAKEAAGLAGKAGHVAETIKRTH